MAKAEKLPTALDVQQNPEGATIGRGLKNAAARAKAMAGTAETLNPPVYDENFQGMSFAGKNMYGVLRTSLATHLDFTGCDFTDADFTYFPKAESGYDVDKRKGLVLQACKFNDCKLDNAVFAYCDLRWADFTGATGMDSVVIEDFDADGQAIPGSQANVFEARGI